MMTKEEMMASADSLCEQYGMCWSMWDKLQELGVMARKAGLEFVMENEREYNNCLEEAHFKLVERETKRTGRPAWMGERRRA